MECLNKTFKPLMLTVFLLSASSVFSQRVVVDARTTAQVVENMIIQLAVENQHNQILDTISSKQEEILVKTSAIYASKELTMQTLQNVKGFGIESMYYKEISITSLKIADLSTQAISAIKKSSMINKANAVLAVGNLSLKTTQLVNDFVNIVTNCTVENPLKKNGLDGAEEKKDSHNLLDRYERMNLAAQISYDLKKIKGQLNAIIFYANYGDWGTLVKQLDHKTWATLFNCKIISDKLVNQWNKQIK